MNRIAVRNPRTRLGSLALALLLGALLMLPAAPAAAQADADTVPTFNLDSVLVSVLGTPIRFGESPYPISVIGKRDLRIGKSGMFLEEALQSLPGVQVQNRFNYAVGERVSIRGFGSRAQFGVRGIQIVVDGIPATLADGQSTLDHLDIASLGRVEALRGPASAIYGNASGGVLRFETEMPAANAPAREEATVVGGSDGLLRLQSTTSGRVGGAAYLVSLNRLSYDGFRHFGTVALEDSAYGGATRTHLNARLVQDMAGGTLGITLNHLNLDAESPGSLARGPLSQDPNQIHPFYSRDRTGKKVQQGQLGVRWTGPVGGLTADAAVYGLTRDFNNPLPNDVVDADRRAAGVRLTLGRSTTSGDTRIGLLAGAEYDLQDDDRREFFNRAGLPDTLQLNQAENVKNAGAFLQASVSMQDRLNLVGAVRRDFTRYKVDDFLIRPAANNPDNSGGRDLNNTNWSLGVHFAALPDVSVFANVSTSFETPTTVELGNQPGVSGGFNPNLEPMTGRTIEGGVRGTLMNRIAFEGSLYRISLENELIAGQAVPGIDYYRNVPKTERTGAEAIVRARLFDFATAQMSYTKVDATFKQATDRYLVDISGKNVPGVAPQQLQGSLRLTQGPWYLDVGAEYTDEVPVNDRNCLTVLAADRTCPTNTNHDGFTLAYTLVGARIGGSAIQLGGFEISPFAGVQNLLNQRYVSSVVPNAFAATANHTNVRFYEPGPGRTFYVGGTVAVSR